MGAGAPGAEVFSGDGEREREGRAREPAGLSVAADQGAGLRRPLCQPGSGPNPLKLRISHLKAAYDLCSC